MKRFGSVASAFVLGGMTGLAMSLLAVLLISDIGIGLYLVAVVVLTAAVLGVSLGIGLMGNRRYMKVGTLAAIAAAAFLTVTTIVTLSQSRLRPSLLWLVWSHRYKSEVLASSAPNGELKQHRMGWRRLGSGATGDWMSYIVFNPSDSLSDATKVPANYSDIPCTVVQVRRLEKHWYSVVTGMNQFWDNMHPGCGPLMTHR